MNSKTKVNRKPVHTTIDADLWQIDLARYCQRHGCDRNEVIEEALREYLFKQSDREQEAEWAEELLK